MRPHLQCTNRDTRACGCCLERQTVELQHREGLTLIRRKFCENCFKLGCRCVPGIGRSLRWFRDKLFPVRAGPTAARIVDGDVARDSEEPGLKCTTRAVVGERCAYYADHH